MPKYAILIDTTFCTGCNTCFYKCVQEYQLHVPASKGITRTVVFVMDRGLYHRRCMHCEDPACVKACPTKALEKTEYGAVLYELAKCNFCLACVNACPFKVPLPDESRKVIEKCSMCAHRIKAGEVPACVEACPTWAIEFGEYEAVAAKAREEARKRGLYLYGAPGVTSVFILTKEDPKKVGYP